MYSNCPFVAVPYGYGVSSVIRPLKRAPKSESPLVPPPIIFFLFLCFSFFSHRSLPHLRSSVCPRDIYIGVAALYERHKGRLQWSLSQTVRITRPSKRLPCWLAVFGTLVKTSSMPRPRGRGFSLNRDFVSHRPHPVSLQPQAKFFYFSSVSLSSFFFCIFLYPPLESDAVDRISLPATAPLLAKNSQCFPTFSFLFIHSCSLNLFIYLSSFLFIHLLFCTTLLYSFRGDFHSWTVILNRILIVYKRSGS